jgi:hypothetical protein
MFMGVENRRVRLLRIAVHSAKDMVAAKDRSK